MSEDSQDPSRGDDSHSSDTTTNLSSKYDNTVFSDADTGELRALGIERKDLAVEANLILFAHPDNRLLGRRFSLAPNSDLTIGRSSSAGISMDGVRSLSRIHARLEHLGAVVVIEDLGSTNGTFVNDQRVVDRHRLRSGDRFQVGALHFKFLHERDPESAYHEAIYQLVMRDGLTRIYNQRKFGEELQKEFERAQRHGRPLSLVFFDIDHFKRINDEHGHLCGDYVLQQVARITQNYLRNEQVFARVGGEEFVVLSPEAGGSGSLQLAEKLRQRFESEALRYGEIEIDLSCSFGVAELEPPMETPEELYEAADRAMYRSKREGRNRVTRYDAVADGEGIV